MTRSEYLEYRKTGAVASIMYEFYKEGFDPTKHKPFLTQGEFYDAVGKWAFSGTDISIFFSAVHSYYDTKLEVMKIMSKEGQITGFV